MIYNNNIQPYFGLSIESTGPSISGPIFEDILAPFLQPCCVHVTNLGPLATGHWSPGNTS